MYLDFSKALQISFGSDYLNYILRNYEGDLLKDEKQFYSDCTGPNGCHDNSFQLKHFAEIPRKMNNYKLLGRAGEGAHGFVFKGLHQRSDTLVALKKITFNPNLGVPKKTMREICALRVLTSRNVKEI